MYYTATLIYAQNNTEKKLCYRRRTARRVMSVDLVNCCTTVGKVVQRIGLRKKSKQWSWSITIDRRVLNYVRPATTRRSSYGRCQQTGPSTSCVDNTIEISYAQSFTGRTPLLQQLIDISCPPGPHSAAADLHQRVCCCWAMLGQTDRRTDIWTDTVQHTTRATATK